MKQSRAKTLGALTAVLWLGFSAPLAAQSTYPNRPIRMLVGFPPGGGVDIVARLMAAEMQKSLGQPITVENRSGAAGNIASDAVAKASADGYTILLGNTGSLSINPALYKQRSFSVDKDLSPIGLISTSPLVVLVSPNDPARTLGDLFKDNPDVSKDKLSYGTGGAGSISHLTFELLQSTADHKYVHVPYRGGAPALTDLMGEQVNVVVEGVPIAAPFLSSNRLRALAVTSDARAPLLPNVPTLHESGFPDLQITAWYGLMAPANTPENIMDQLNAAMNKALEDPAVRQKLAQQGSDPAGGTREAFGSFLQNENTRWAKAVETSGASLD